MTPISIKATVIAGQYTQFDRAMVATMAQAFDALPAVGNRLAMPAAGEAQRESLPPWAVDLLRTMTAENL